jgi:hypothetical protein
VAAQTDFFQFFAALAHSFAWPVTVIIAVFLLRAALADQIRSLHSLRYKDFQLEFDRKLEKIFEGTADIV